MSRKPSPNQAWRLPLRASRAAPLASAPEIASSGTGPTQLTATLLVVNDSLTDARRFPDLLAGIPSKVNLIPWNPHPQAPYQRPEPSRVHAFQQELIRLGFTVFVRKTRGDDIDAACGQLAADRDPRAAQARKLARLTVLQDRAAQSDSGGFSL